MKRTFILLFPLFLTLQPAAAATVALYDFNGTGTATVGSAILDTTGNHNGTVAGGNLLYGWDPNAGSYLTFAADAGAGNPANRVVIPGSSDFLFSLTQAYTIETIFRTTQTGTTLGVIVSKGADVADPDSQWWLRNQGNGQLRGDIEGVDNTTEDVATSTGTPLINDGLWHRAALVYNGAAASKRLDLYIDGSLRGSDTSIGTLGVIGGTDSDPVIIGEFASLALARSFAGDIAAVRFSNSALTPAEFLIVPEPNAYALLLAGLTLSALRRPKRLAN